MHIFVTRELPGCGLDRLRAAHSVEVWPHELPPSRAQLLEHTSSADAVLSLLTDRIDEAFLDARPRLRAISNYAVGFENIDITAATARGIPVGHTPGALTSATAEHTIALILALLRRVGEADASVRRGEWRTWVPTRYLGRSLSETTLGLIGYGRIGRQVGTLAEGLGLRVLPHAARDGNDNLKRVLGASDVVSLHASLTDDTAGLMNAEAFALMRRGSMLVNVARGRMVETAALVDALRSGQLSGAALDVAHPEPLPAGHELLSFDNVIVTPHIASATTPSRAQMTTLAVENLLAALDGKPMPHCTNPEVYANPDPRT